MADSLFRANNGDGGYVMTIPAANVEFHAHRLRWQGDDLKGELAVMCGIVGGRAVDGVLARGTFNFSSPKARSDHGTYLAKRARTGKEHPWTDWLEELYEHIVRDQRDGLPAGLLRDIPLPGAEVEHSICGWRVPALDAAIAFGDAEAGKSVLALYAAGVLAAQGVPTLYCDFEWTAAPHRVRLGSLVADAGELPPVHYVECRRPLVYEAEAIGRYQRKHGIRYTVFDSCGYGCHGKPEDAEIALAYFRALRSLQGGSLHLAHITKPSKGDTAADRDTSTQRPFGSTFWHTSARSTWFFKRTNPDTAGPDAPLVLGLFHRKFNAGPRYPALGFQMTFRDSRIDITRVDLAQIDELGSKLPVWQRMRELLKHGALPTSAIAEHLDVDEPTVRQALKRDADRAGRAGKVSMFTRVDGGLIGLLERKAS